MAGTATSLVFTSSSVHVTGGRVYGCRNTDVLGAPDTDGRQKRPHVVREIHSEQAEVIRRIFRLYADGAGFKPIADRLNRDGVPGPRSALGWATMRQGDPPP